MQGLLMITSCVIEVMASSATSIAEVFRDYEL